MKKIRIILTGSLILLSLIWPLSSQPRAATDAVLEELDLYLSGQTLREWYNAQSGNNGGDDFGAYITYPVGVDLYIGFGSARPAKNIGDGAYLSKFDMLNLTGIAEIDEQGFHEMIWDGALLHIAGTDPHNGDDHSAGNHYTYTPSGSLTKYRDPVNGLKFVYHTWGLWKDGGTLYAAASAHDGTYPDTDLCEIGTSCMGQIFASTNNGSTWTLKSDLGGYRAFDIIGFDGDLYAIHSDVHGGELSMSKSADGLIWTPIADNLRQVHLIEHNSRLVAVDFDRDKLHSVDANDTVTTHDLPENYLVGVSYPEASYSDYNIMVAVDNDLYLIAENQLTSELAILRTNDLSNWEEVVKTTEKLISLSYWPNTDMLITATPGADAKLLKVDLSGGPTALTLQTLRLHAGKIPSVVWAGLMLGMGLVLVWMRRHTRTGVQAQTEPTKS